MTDRRILFLLTYLSGRRSSFRDSGRVDDGQTNSVLIDLSVWPSIVIPSQRAPQLSITYAAVFCRPPHDHDDDLL
jgi:hypothetical protein